jgi:hypothetical protein
LKCYPFHPRLLVTATDRLGALGDFQKSRGVLRLFARIIRDVWEWCKDDGNNMQPVICGGSCLSPPEYASPDSKYEFKGRASDVGFRVIVPAK